MPQSPDLTCFPVHLLSQHLPLKTLPYCSVGLQVLLMGMRPCPTHQIECCRWLKCWALTTSPGHSRSSEPLCDSYEEVKEETVTQGKPYRYSVWVAPCPGSQTVLDQKTGRITFVEEFCIPWEASLDNVDLLLSGLVFQLLASMGGWPGVSQLLLGSELA